MKPRSDILKPDSRFRNMVGGIAPDGIRMMCLDDLYDQAAKIQLGPNVPAHIAAQFDKALHAYVYSWFAFDLATLAEQQGYQTLELALREKLPISEREKADHDHWGLRKLFGRAFAHGWLRPRGFVTGTTITKCNFLAICRDELAHGSTNLFPGGSLVMLGLCAEILRELFGETL
jgi:hypothetical protein